MFEYEIINEITTNAKSEDDLKTIFNSKLATLIIYYENRVKEHC